MRPAIFIAAALLLAGCETGNGWIPGSDEASNPPSRETASTPGEASAPVIAQRAPVAQSASTYQLTASVDEHCKAVARLRASDARANGYSLEMEDTIFQGTYKDCVVWDTRHGE